MKILEFTAMSRYLYNLAQVSRVNYSKAVYNPFSILTSFWCGVNRIMWCSLIRDKMLHTLRRMTRSFVLKRRYYSNGNGKSIVLLKLILNSVAIIFRLPQQPCINAKSFMWRITSQSHRGKCYAVWMAA